MEKIFVFGCGGHSKVVIDIVEGSGQFEVAGVVAEENVREKSFLGYPILTQNDLYASSVKAGVIAIGDNWQRSKVVSDIRKAYPDFQFKSVVHRSAVLARGVKLGEGTVVMAGVVINSDVEIGEHCIINTSSSIDHDSKVFDFASVAPGVILGGRVTVGKYTAVSLGAIVIHGLSIGDHSVVGAGAVLVESIPDRVVAFGIPCKPVRKREVGEKYL